jgi:hypothetical protein
MRLAPARRDINHAHLNSGRPPALNRAKAMFSLALKLQLSYRQVVQLVVFLLMLIR